MTVNIPRALQDHAPTSLDEIDREITALLERLRKLFHDKNTLQLHLQVQEMLNLPRPESVLVSKQAA